MALQVVKIAEYTRSGSGNENTGIILVDTRTRWFVNYPQSGESGAEYDVRLDIDLENQSVTETILHTKTDGICRHGLKIFGKNITTRRFGAYGEVGGHCPNKGHLMDLDNPDNYVCTCDGYSNCNLTSNLGSLRYDPVTDKIIASGDCSGRWIWIIDPNDLSILGRISESAIRSETFCNIVVVPVDDERILVIAGKQNSNYIRIGLVDVQDLIDNASSNPNVDDLGSWEELVKDTSRAIRCSVFEASCGKTVRFKASDSDVLFNPVNNSITPVSAPLWSGLGYGLFIGSDDSNGLLKISDENGNVVQEISDSDIFGKTVSIAGWFYTLTNTSTQDVLLKALAIDGHIPWIEWDFNNNRFRVIDYITGNPISMDVYLIWSRLQGSLVVTVDLPLVLNNRVQKITVNDWTHIPNPPNANVRVLYVVPDFASALQQ